MSKFISELGYKEAFEMFLKISSGKKLRSKLLLKIAGESEISLKLCAIIELIHLASLLHDDVIDEANIRRGNPSINALFGSKNSVMLGDILYSKAYFELTKFDPSIAAVISDAVSKLSIGEMMDVKMAEKRSKISLLINNTAGTNTDATLSANRAIGAFEPCASDNAFIISPSKVWLPS